MRINFYLETTEKLISSKEIFDREVNSIEVARQIVIQHIDRGYRDIKYKISIIKPYGESTIIRVIFDKDILIERDFKIKNLLDDK